MTFHDATAAHGAPGDPATGVDVPPKQAAAASLPEDRTLGVDALDPASGALPPVPGAGSFLERTVQHESEEAWLASRQHFLGASEIAAALGLSIYKDSTPFRVWQGKVQPAKVAFDEKQRRNFRRGHRAEAAVLGEFADEHLDLRVRPLQLVTVGHPVYPLVRCSPDALLCGGPVVAGADAKFMEVHSRHHFGEPGSDILPADYVAQGLVSCECLEVPRWHFAVWLGRNDYREYVVERDTRVAEGLITRALEWWHDYVEPRRYPPIDASESARKFLLSLWPKDTRPMLPATDEAVVHARGSRAARDAVAAAEQAQDFHDNRLRELCQDAAGIAGVCTYRANRSSSKTDWQAVARELGMAVGAPAFVRAVEHHTTTKPGARVLRLTYEGETT